MSDLKSDIEFTSKTFPNEKDMARWNAMSPAEQRAYIEASEQAGFESGVAPDESLSDRLSRVRRSAS